MKRFFVACTLLVIILTGCSLKKESIEGYWMAENGETLSFTADGKVIQDGITANYSIYGENNISFSFLGMATEGKFKIKNDVLTLIDLEDNSTDVFYRNEKKQQKIRQKLLDK